MSSLSFSAVGDPLLPPPALPSPHLPPPREASVAQRMCPGYISSASTPSPPTLSTSKSTAPSFGLFKEISQTTYLQMKNDLRIKILFAKN